MMVSQGGTGSGVSGPSVAELYKTLFGRRRQPVDLAQAHRREATRPRRCRTYAPDGTVVQPPRGHPTPQAGLPDEKARREDEGTLGG